MLTSKWQYIILFGLPFSIIIIAWHFLTSINLNTTGLVQQGINPNDYVGKLYAPSQNINFITKLDIGGSNLVQCNFLTKELAEQMSRVETENPDQKFISRQKVDKLQFFNCMVTADQILIHKKAENGGAPIINYLESTIKPVEQVTIKQVKQTKIIN